LETAATEDEIAAEKVAAKTSTNVAAFMRKLPSRKPFPELLPRERVVAVSRQISIGDFRRRIPPSV
jgi:transposase